MNLLSMITIAKYTIVLYGLGIKKDCGSELLGVFGRVLG